jgi:putative tricarboxylic transport membrane protein
MFTVGITIFFGVIGYFMKKMKVPAAPMVLAIVLGYLTESNLRQALIIGDGSFINVITKPISLTILIISVLMAFGTPIIGLIKKKIVKTVA